MRSATSRATSTVSTQLVWRPCRVEKKSSGCRVGVAEARGSPGDPSRVDIVIEIDEKRLTRYAERDLMLSKATLKVDTTP